MNQFTVEPKPENNSINYLEKSVSAFYHSKYESGSGQWRIEGRIENLICTLKNDITRYEEQVLNNACNRLKNILKEDFNKIVDIVNKDDLLVCVVPRAKVEYDANQLYFKKTVKEVTNEISNLHDGTDYIIRVANTKTTHRSRWGHGGEGRMPYPGITKDTCEFSNDIVDEDILLIDDLYTNSVNIDEDAIQALYDKGAKCVYFYSIGAKLAL